MFSSGTDLWKTLQKLNIVTGSVGINVVEGWYDTDNKDLVDFLRFIADCVSEENAFMPIEIAEYKELKEEGKTLQGSQYEKAIKEVGAKHKGIFEFEENLSKVSLLEKQRKSLLDYKNHLDDLSFKNRRELTEIERLISTAETEQLYSHVSRKECGETCLNLSMQLDDINIRLCDQFNSYESYATPSYLSDFSLDIYVPYYNDIITLLSLVDTPEYGDLSVLKSTMKTCQKMKTIRTDEYLEQIKQRVFQSMKFRRNKEILLAKLRGELKFCNEFNVTFLVGFSGYSVGVDWPVKANIYSKKEIYNMWMLNFENKLTKASNKYIDQHTLLGVLENLHYTENKLQYVQQIEKRFSHILSNYLILYALFTTNFSHLKKYYENFKTVHKYVIDDVQRCSLRIKSMTSVMEEHEAYLGLPFEEKDSLVKSLIQFLSAENPTCTDLRSTCNFILERERKCHDTEKKLFVEDPEQFRKLARDLDSNTRILKKFITNGPTMEFISVQYRLYKIFKDMDDLFISPNESIYANINKLNKTVKQVSNNEWLKYKRLLWMYFLIEPKKVQRLISKIEEEVRTRIKENLK